MANSKIKLSRDEFFLLHTLIEKECDHFLQEEGKKNGINKTNEQYYYGFLQGEPEMKAPNDARYNRSIKYVILAKIGNEIGDNAQNYGFRSDSSSENIKFNGRHLHNLKKKYNKGTQEISIAKEYLSAFLRLLNAETIDDLKDRYLAENGTSHLSIIEDSITPARTSRSYSKEDETQDPESVLKEEKTLPIKQPHHKVEKKFESKLKVLENTDWYYYRFDYKNEEKPQSIMRMVFRIGQMLENGDLEIELIANSSTFSDYAGTISRSDSNDKILICRLSTKKVGAKLKVLMFHIEPRFKSQIYLGQYLEYDDDHHIMSGTILIEKTSHTREMDLGSKVFHYGSKEMEAEIDPNIQYYFEDKYMNFTKTPTGISTPFDFQAWLHKKRFEREKDNPSRIYDLYISVPFVELKNDMNKLHELEDLINRMSNTTELKNIGIDKNKIHHRTIESNRNFDAGFLLRRDQEAIQKSKAFLFIFPQETKIVTSVFIQAGYAIHGGFPTFILYKNLDCLPYSLQVSDRLAHVQMKKIESIQDILSFPEWVHLNEYYKLYRKTGRP